MKTLPVTVWPVRDASSSLPLPVLGSTAACGFPSPAEDFFREEDRLDLNAKLAPNPPATFLVQADCGGSMADFGIHDGDLLVVDRSISPRPGHTVVALWEGGFVCKKLYMRNNCMVLASGSGYPSIVVPEDVELEIWGVVRWSITQHL
ncbi:translesion error-prone DNA polymerase V autoproteolytic subunit [Stenotrophomonas maltophilia]|uniref:LexA family protein n=1 Tax=unclassified Stenotrophomonas TaxID=196198 RepID=UPI00095196EA|nr:MULTISPECIES: translesion error-prone DNA polymerase V autoproteolytic subunit [unclassified Stenotrophomonas]MBH1425613.1 translesion error-prone DNA polymerase V autoproteolytic subunit [Stenotrophomonas maltophilia]MBH1873217.1 translesion error-prone DNA polymerase V autoproteolytic subunit [Stenotrophomonas maltophilia]OMO40635.1 hypothetical protein BU225_12440 [Stenotrophomonas sp. MB339]